MYFCPNHPTANPEDYLEEERTLRELAEENDICDGFEQTQIRYMTRRDQVTDVEDDGGDARCSDHDIVATWYNTDAEYWEAVATRYDEAGWYVCHICFAVFNDEDMYDEHNFTHDDVTEPMFVPRPQHVRATHTATIDIGGVPHRFNTLTTQWEPIRPRPTTLHEALSE